ncbi:hypothetical protein ACVWXM_004397 [Bradyrhizobium sp. GM7.3]
MVDQHGHVEILVFGDAGDDAVLLGLDLDVPAELADARNRAGKIGIRQHSAELLAEAEARAADPSIMQLGKIRIVRLGEHQRVGAAAIVRAHRGETVEHDGMVGAIRRGLHDDAALDAERLVHAQRRLPGRGRHPIGSTGTLRIFVEGAEHVKLAVEGFGRRPLDRAARVRVERKIGRHAQNSLSRLRR